VNIITLAAKGAPQFEQIPLKALHDVRSISGCFAELLQAQIDGDASMDYIQAFLTDEAPVLDAMQRLRQVYPNLVIIRMAVAQVGEYAGALVARDLNNPEQRFLEFFHWVKGQEPNEAELQAFQVVLQAELHAEQEMQIQAEPGAAL
jgi:exonuclease SbcD